MTGVSFVVHGTPAPQGSKSLGRHGGVREANPRTRPWRAAVAAEAALAMNGREPLDGPVSVAVTFGFVRPKSHYRTGRNANVLRDAAPHYRDSGCDLDKLCRAIGDALTGVVLRDDRQIVIWAAQKLWRRAAYAEISVLALAREAGRVAAATEETA